MDRYWEWIWLAFSLLVLLTDTGFGYSIIEGPRNLTILAGSVAHFNCTVSEGYKILIWLFNGTPILTVLGNGTPVITNPKYNQDGFQNGTEFTSGLKIFDVQLHDSGEIKCSLQNFQEDKYAFLSVQVNGSLTIKPGNLTVRENQTTEIICEALGWAPAPQISWMVNNITLDNSMYITNQSQGSNGLYNEESILTLTPVTNSTVTCFVAIDALPEPQNATVTLTVYQPPSIAGDDGRTRTIILAVVLSVVGFLLLILIILLIICCCKRRKDSKYQEEMRKASEKKNADRNLETDRHSGQENYAYSPEETRRAGQMTGVPSFSPDNSSLYAPDGDLDVNPASQISPQFSSSSQSLQRISPAPSFHNVNRRSQKGAAQQSRAIPTVRFRSVSSKSHKSRAPQLRVSKLHPHIYRSDGKRRHTRKVYPQRWQSGGQHRYTRRPTHHPEQSKAQDTQTHHSRKQHLPHRGQQKESPPRQSEPHSQQRLQEFQRKQLYPDTRTKVLRVQPPP
ncbi:immunoglobulin superfamily member 5 isoform X1 [Podarcis raffonei]|uniref:immunoglobulin superfamily member 5 isoform X1 n=1 Tax=Podarcis raffonei TaxID=65483 RepID=UPI0023292A06|nr:immunoglobulin superfamily member 5 isoform X1 [Podarcis raffonei]